jgi:hypothetical protein
MRFFLASAIFVFALAGISGARGADLGVGGGVRGFGDHFVAAERAGALIIYDYEPGVVQRAYWLPGWRGRHYFPFHAEKVRQSPAPRPKPAESYFRYWSNDGAFLNGLPPAALHSYDRAPAPRRRNSSQVLPPEKSGSATPNENADD